MGFMVALSASGVVAAVAPVGSEPQSFMWRGTATGGVSVATISTTALTTLNGDMVLGAATAANNGTYTAGNGFTRGHPEASASFGDINPLCKQFPSAPDPSTISV